MKNKIYFKFSIGWFLLTMLITGCQIVPVPAAEEETMIEEMPKPMTTITDVSIKELKGIIYPPIPPGFQITNSGFILDSEYNFSFIKYNEELIGVFECQYNPGSENQVSKKIILDTLLLPDLEENELFLTLSCELNGIYDEELIAVGKIDEETEIKRWIPNGNIVQVWRLNRKLGTIEEFGTEGVECSAEGGSYWSN